MSITSLSYDILAGDHPLFFILRKRKHPLLISNIYPKFYHDRNEIHFRFSKDGEFEVHSCTNYDIKE